VAEPRTPAERLSRLAGDLRQLAAEVDAVAGGDASAATVVGAYIDHHYHLLVVGYTGLGADLEAVIDFFTKEATP
jgi:hypothetical protein